MAFKNKPDILASLKPLFDKAEKEWLWFHSSYQDLWFSPEELRQAQKEGRFVWGPENWTLRNPNEHLGELENAVEAAQQRVADFLKRLQRSN